MIKLLSLIKIGLRKLVDDWSFASCQQTYCKLVGKTCYPQACCKLLQQVVTSVQMVNCKNLILVDLLQLGEIEKVVASCQPEYCFPGNLRFFYAPCTLLGMNRPIASGNKPHFNRLVAT